MNRVQTTFQSSSLSASPIVFHFVSIKIIKISPNTTSFSTHRDSGSEFPCQFYTSHFLPQISCYPEKSPLVNLSQFSETWSLSFLCFCPLTSLAEWATARVINIYLLLTLYDQLQLAKRLFLVVYCRLTDGTVNLKLVSSSYFSTQIYSIGQYFRAYRMNEHRSEIKVGWILYWYLTPCQEHEDKVW